MLDVGAKDSPYKHLFNKGQYFSTDIKYNENLSFVAGLMALPIKSNSLDLVVCTEVLEHVNNPQLVVKQLFNVLRRNGILIVTVPSIYRFHPDPVDYWRFTSQGIKKLLEHFNLVSFEYNGGIFSVLGEMIRHIIFYVGLKFLLPATEIFIFLDRLLPSTARAYSLGFFVVCKKGA